MPSSTEYVALESFSDEHLPLDTSRQSRATLRASSGNSRLFYWSCIGALCSTALSFIIFFAKDAILSQPGVRISTHLPERTLRRPSHYINLDQVLHKHNFPPIVNFPQMVLQINNSDPKRMMREDDRSWRSNLGTVYPDDRHIVISAEVSTIIQFRHIDYAMERCVLNVTVPKRNDKFDRQFNITYPSIFHIWILDTTAEILRSVDATWKSAPRRRKLFATLIFSQSDGESLSSEEFHCPSNEFTTFELSYSPTSPLCRVDFWQERRVLPASGVFLTQFSTINRNDKGIV